MGFMGTTQQTLVSQYLVFKSKWQEPFLSSHSCHVWTFNKKYFNICKCTSSVHQISHVWLQVFTNNHANKNMYSMAQNKITKSWQHCSLWIFYRREVCVMLLYHWSWYCVLVLYVYLR